MTQPAADPRVPGALKRYRIMAIITGSFLLAVFIGLFAKLILGDGANPTFVTVTGLIAMVHGWIYVIYLATTVHLWLLMRWGLGRLVVMALGGVVPFLSFVLERRIATEARATVAGSVEP